MSIKNSKAGKHPIDFFLKKVLPRIATNCYRLSSASVIPENQHQPSDRPLGLSEERIQKRRQHPSFTTHR
jgi:hypothetical protein